MLQEFIVGKTDQDVHVFFFVLIPTSVHISNLSKPVWTYPNLFEPIWTYPNLSEPNWTYPNLSDPILGPQFVF